MRVGLARRLAMGGDARRQLRLAKEHLQVIKARAETQKADAQK